MSLLEKFINLIVLFGSALIATLAFGFTACSEEDDDPNDMISGSNNNYSINYTNSSSDTSRGYKTTTFRHRGALTQITFNKDSLEESGAMSVIWDLESNATRSATEPRTFNIAGLTVKKSGSGYVAVPYVSVYKNVVDMQLRNFGTGQSVTATTGSNKGTAYTATETEVLKLSSTSFAVTPDATTGAVTVTINAVEETDSDDNYTGNYVVSFYAGAYTDDTISSATAAKTATITYKQMGYKAYDSTATDTTNMLSSKNRLPENYNAVYANVYTGKTLNATWKYIGTYSSADVVEE